MLHCTMYVLHEFPDDCADSWRNYSVVGYELYCPQGQEVLLFKKSRLALGPTQPPM
jgi:hypothetical protein